MWTLPINIDKRANLRYNRGRYKYIKGVSPPATLSLALRAGTGGTLFLLSNCIKNKGNAYKTPKT